MMEILREVGEEMRAEPEWNDDILTPIEVLGIDALLETGYTLRARIKTQPSRQLAVGREFILRVKRAFDKNEIILPTPLPPPMLAVSTLPPAPPKP